MASTPTHFASGTVSSSLISIYTAPTSPTTSMYEVNKLVFTNTASTVETLSVWRDDGIARIVETVQIQAGKTYISNPVIGSKLAPTHEIQAVSTTDGVVNFQIDGKITG